MIVSRRKALADVEEQAVWIADDDPGVAERFVVAVEKTLRLLEQMPMAGASLRTSIPSLQGIRKMRVAGFPRHLVFYRPFEGGVIFIRLLHSSREMPKAILR